MAWPIRGSLGKWFVQGHDATAAVALRAVEELRLPHQQALLGYGPERSVVEAAVRELRGPAHQLVSPAQGRLAAPENRPLLSAVRAASRMRMTGAHWVLLLTTSRECFGSPRSQRAQGLYAVLEQVAARHAVPVEPAGSPC